MGPHLSTMQRSNLEEIWGFESEINYEQFHKMCRRIAYISGGSENVVDRNFSKMMFAECQSGTAKRVGLNRVSFQNFYEVYRLTYQTREVLADLIPESAKIGYHIASQVHAPKEGRHGSPVANRGQSLRIGPTPAPIIAPQGGAESDIEAGIRLEFQNKIKKAEELRFLDKKKATAENTKKWQNKILSNALVRRLEAFKKCNGDSAATKIQAWWKMESARMRVKMSQQTRESEKEAIRQKEFSIGKAVFVKALVRLKDEEEEEIARHEVSRTGAQTASVPAMPGAQLGGMFPPGFVGAGTFPSVPGMGVPAEAHMPPGILVTSRDKNTYQRNTNLLQKSTLMAQGMEIRRQKVGEHAAPAVATTTEQRRPSTPKIEPPAKGVSLKSAEEISPKKQSPKKKPAKKPKESPVKKTPKRNPKHQMEERAGEEEEEEEEKEEEDDEEEAATPKKKVFKTSPVAKPRQAEPAKSSRASDASILGESLPRSASTHKRGSIAGKSVDAEPTDEPKEAVSDEPKDPKAEALDASDRSPAADRKRMKNKESSSDEDLHVSDRQQIKDLRARGASDVATDNETGFVKSNEQKSQEQISGALPESAQRQSFAAEKSESADGSDGIAAGSSAERIQAKSDTPFLFGEKSDKANVGEKSDTLTSSSSSSSSSATSSSSAGASTTAKAGSKGAEKHGSTAASDAKLGVSGKKVGSNNAAGTSSRGHVTLGKSGGSMTSSKGAKKSASSASSITRGDVGEEGEEITGGEGQGGVKGENGEEREKGEDGAGEEGEGDEQLEEGGTTHDDMTGSRMAGTVESLPRGSFTSGRGPLGLDKSDLVKGPMTESARLRDAGPGEISQSVATKSFQDGGIEDPSMALVRQLLHGTGNQQSGAQIGGQTGTQTGGVDGQPFDIDNFQFQISFDDDVKELATHIKKIRASYQGAPVGEGSTVISPSRQMVEYEYKDTDYKFERNKFPMEAEIANHLRNLSTSGVNLVSLEHNDAIQKAVEKSATEVLGRTSRMFEDRLKQLDELDRRMREREEEQRMRWYEKETEKQHEMIRAVGVAPGQDGADKKKPINININLTGQQVVNPDSAVNKRTSSSSGAEETSDSSAQMMKYSQSVMHKMADTERENAWHRGVAAQVNRNGSMERESLTGMDRFADAMFDDYEAQHRMDPSAPKPVDKKFAAMYRQNRNPHLATDDYLVRQLEENYATRDQVDTHGVGGVDQIRYRTYSAAVNGLKPTFSPPSKHVPMDFPKSRKGPVDRFQEKPRVHLSDTTNRIRNPIGQFDKSKFVNSLQLDLQSVRFEFVPGMSMSSAMAGDATGIPSGLGRNHGKDLRTAIQLGTSIESEMLEAAALAERIGFGKKENNSTFTTKMSEEVDLAVSGDDFLAGPASFTAGRTAGSQPRIPDPRASSTAQAGASQAGDDTASINESMAQERAEASKCTGESVSSPKQQGEKLSTQKPISKQKSMSKPKSLSKSTSKRKSSSSSVSSSSVSSSSD